MKKVDTKEFETLSCFLKSERGHSRVEFILRLLAIDKINRLNEHSGAYTGARFTSELLDDPHVNYVAGNAKPLKSLPEESLITVSNYPCGILDGIISTTICTAKND